VRTRVLREGGSTATVGAELEQDGTTRISALATYGHLGSLPGDVGTTAPEPVLPPPEECLSNQDAPPRSSWRSPR
jgi:hypothetical protein